MSSRARRLTQKRFLDLMIASRALLPLARQAAIDQAWLGWSEAHPAEAAPLARQDAEPWSEWFERTALQYDWIAFADAFCAKDPVVKAAELATRNVRSAQEVYFATPEEGR